MKALTFYAIPFLQINLVCVGVVSDKFNDKASDKANDVCDESDENEESDQEALMYKGDYFSLLTISTFENLSENESSGSKLSFSDNKTIPLHKWKVESDDELDNVTLKGPD